MLVVEEVDRREVAQLASVVQHMVALVVLWQSNNDLVLADEQLDDLEVESHLHMSLARTYSHDL